MGLNHTASSVFVASLGQYLSLHDLTSQNSSPSTLTSSRIGAPNGRPVQQSRTSTISGARCEATI